MKHISTLIVLIEQAVSELNAKGRRVFEIEQEFCRHCPIKVGETVLVDDGYSHAGKQMRVTHVAFIGGGQFGKDRRHYWILTGPVIRKDGTETIRYGRHSIEVEK